jgi:hypothetical protein
MPPKKNIKELMPKGIPKDIVDIVEDYSNDNEETLRENLSNIESSLNINPDYINYEKMGDALMEFFKEKIPDDDIGSYLEKNFWKIVRVFTVTDLSNLLSEIFFIVYSESGNYALDDSQITAGRRFLFLISLVMIPFLKKFFSIYPENMVLILKKKISLPI